MGGRPALQITSDAQEEVTRLAAPQGQTVADALADAVRLLRQEEIDRELAGL